MLRRLAFRGCALAVMSTVHPAARAEGVRCSTPQLGFCEGVWHAMQMHAHRVMRIVAREQAEGVRCSFPQFGFCEGVSHAMRTG